MIENLEPENLYAIEYKYGKESPFTYSESKRFIINTPKNNDIIYLNIFNNSINQTINNIDKLPIKLIIQNISLYSINSKIINKKFNKTKNDEINENFYTLYIIIQLEKNYYNYKIGINLDPFCEYNNSFNYLINNTNEINENNQNNNNSNFFFWLNNKQPYKILQHFDVLTAICNTNFLHSICKNLNKNINNINKNCYSSIFCYTPSILLNKKLFNMNKYCINLANYISLEISNNLNKNLTTKSVNNFAILLNYLKIKLLINFFLIFFYYKFLLI